VPCLGRRPARTGAAKMVLGRALGPDGTPGRHRPLSVVGPGSRAFARSTRTAASRAVSVMARPATVATIRPAIALYRNARKTGTSNTLTIATMMAKGVPTFTKSPKLYCPGPTTSVFTGEEIGVMKAVDAASATVIANG